MPFFTIPTMDAAALSKTARLIGLMPRMSITEWITMMSRVPMRVPKWRLPEAIGVTMYLGHADGQRLHGGRPQHRALGPAQADYALEPPLREQIEGYLPHAIFHLGHRRSASARVSQRLDSRTGGPGNLRRAECRAQYPAARPVCPNRAPAYPRPGRRILSRT